MNVRQCFVVIQFCIQGRKTNRCNLLKIIVY